MDTKVIQQMKALLEQEKETLVGELETVSSPDSGDHAPGNRAPRFPNYGDDALNANDDSPSEVEDYTVNVNVTGTLSDRLAQVDGALSRIESGTYGVCAKCNKPIPEERLKVNPAAEMCMECANAHV